ncbi:MAG: cysteine desulfurase [Chlamydiae bacterium]|nr:cysteine desulfurase [Chlamydiota bacterium]
MKTRIYLDNNATTFVDPRVLEAMIPVFSTFGGNPSSIHHFGQEARNLLQNSRTTIARYLQVKPNELFFTSGGTEAINMILQGFFAMRKGHIISSTIEHSAVYHTLQFLEKQGCRVTFLPVGLTGAVTLSQVEESITPDTCFIALSAANSETGVKTDIEGIANLAKAKGIPFFVDGVALLGKEPFHVPDGVSAMAFSGHKLHAPKGIGLAFLRSTLSIPPLLLGGGQEYGKRSGTENLPGIVGLAKAIELLEIELPKATEEMQSLKAYFETTLVNQLGNVVINGSGPRVCNTSNLSFPGLDGESLLIHLDLAGIAASHGSACSSGALEPSRVLRNMGLEKSLAQSAIRFSLSRFTTKSEVEMAVSLLVNIVSRMKRALANN